jgi:hypothetical protein
MSPDEIMALLSQPGVLVAIAVVVLSLVALLLKPRAPGTFLNPQEFQTLPLTQIIDITHNTKKFIFSLPHPKMKIGLPTGQHITFLAKDSDGKDVYRPYTPVTDDDTPGRVEFVIKLYPQGKMSQILAKMKVGDTMLMKGPRGRFQYTRNMKKALGEQPAAARRSRVRQQGLTEAAQAAAAGRCSHNGANDECRCCLGPGVVQQHACEHPSRCTAGRATGPAASYCWQLPSLLHILIGLTSQSNVSACS